MTYIVQPFINVCHYGENFSMKKNLRVIRGLRIVLE